MSCVLEKFALKNVADEKMRVEKFCAARTGLTTVWVVAGDGSHFVVWNHSGLMGGRGSLPRQFASRSLFKHAFHPVIRQAGVAELRTGGPTLASSCLLDPPCSCGLHQQVDYEAEWLLRGVENPVGDTRYKYVEQSQRARAL